MAVNYNILRPEGPTNLYEGFAAGQQAAAQNALAQQKMAQERDLMSMRRQEFQANIESTQADRRRKAVAEKTAMFRDRVLRAPTPQAARELVRLQHSDPDLGPVIQQFGSLDQDLADIPDDPTGFENWRQREAMGAAEFIKSQASEQRFQALVARARGGQQGAAVPSAAPGAAVPVAAAPAGELVAAPMPSPTGTVRNIAPGGAVGPETSIAQNLASFRNTPPKGTKDIFGGQLSQEDKQRIEQHPGIKDRYETYSRNAAFFLNTPPDDYYYRNNVHLLAEQAKELSDLTGVKVPGTVEELRQVLNIGQPAAQPPATANVLAPAAAPVTNAMLASAAQPAAARPAGGGRTPEQIRAEIDILSMDNDPRAARMVQTLQKEYAAALEAQGKTTTPQIKEIGVTTTTNEPVFFDARTDQLFTIGTDASGRQVRKPYTGGVNRATSTVTATATSSTPTAKSLSAEVGDRARTSLTKAEGAAGIMESANMVREALNTGNVIAGPLAGIRTKFAQVLELAGAGDKEKLVATRTAIQGLATLTLESRAELRGQGQVTVDEQKLLERARSGNVEDMTIAELQQVVNVSQRLANRMWSSHQNLLKTMEGDPNATDTIRYYRPTMPLPQAIGEGRPQREADERTQRLKKIFDSQQQQQR